jgi:hypothetical protein
MAEQKITRVRLYIPFDIISEENEAEAITKCQQQIQVAAVEKNLQLGPLQMWRDARTKQWVGECTVQS